MNISHRELFHKEGLLAQEALLGPLRACGEVRRVRSGQLSTPELQPQGALDLPRSPGNVAIVPEEKPWSGAFTFLFPGPYCCCWLNPNQDRGSGIFSFAPLLG